MPTTKIVLNAEGRSVWQRGRGRSYFTWRIRDVANKQTKRGAKKKKRQIKMKMANLHLFAFSSFWTLREEIFVVFVGVFFFFIARDIWIWPRSSLFVCMCVCVWKHTTTYWAHSSFQFNSFRSVLLWFGFGLVWSGCFLPLCGLFTRHIFH